MSTSDQASWEQTWEVFHAALALDEDSRADYLRGACAGSEELQREVEQLLAEASSGSGVLDRPVLLASATDAEAAPGEALVPLEPGRLLGGRFEVQEELGRGGMGTVHAALDRETGSRIALKTLRPDLALDPGTIRRFRRELVLARQVTHPNACRTFDLFRDDEDADRPLTFLTMELLEGETLAARLAREGPLDSDEALGIAEQVAAGLEAAHAAGVVHRDLKSANVMLCPTEDGLRAVVTDFGIATTTLPETDDEARETRPGQLVGSLATMAPEQLRGRTATPASDVHGLGVLLFEMVTGRLPFPGESPLDRALRRLKEEPIALRSLRADLPKPWEATLRRCLAADPGERPESPAAVLEALRRPVESRRWLRASGVLVAVLAVAGLITGWSRKEEAPREANAALPVAVGAGAAAAAPVRAQEPPPLIGVLELESAAEDEALAVGLTLALTDRLSHFSGLGVIDAASVHLADDGTASIEGIAEQLEATHLIRGSFAESDAGLRLDAWIHDAARRRELGPFAVSGELGDGLRLAADLSLQIADALQVEMPDGEHARITRVPSAAPAAERAFLEAWALTRTGSREEFMAKLDEALVADPTHPSALGARAAVQAGITRRLRGEEMVAGWRLTEEHAHAALAVDPDSADALWTLALAVDLRDNDFAAAEAGYRRVLEVRPNDDEARGRLARLLAVTERGDQAVAEAEHALALNPLSRLARNRLGGMYTLSGDLESSIAHYRALVAAHPEDSDYLNNLAWALATAGRADEALELVPELCRLMRRCSLQRAAFQALAGQTTEAQEAVAAFGRAQGQGKRPSGRRTPPQARALLLLSLGRHDEAVRALDEAASIMPSTVRSVAIHPLWAPVRDRQDFREVVCRHRLAGCTD